MAISDVGKSENQPVSIEVLEVAQEEIARLQAEGKRLRATIEAQQAQIRAFFCRGAHGGIGT